MTISILAQPQRKSRPPYPAILNNLLYEFAEAIKVLWFLIRLRLPSIFIVWGVSRRDYNRNLLRQGVRIGFYQGIKFERANCAGCGVIAGARGLVEKALKNPTS